MLHNNLSEELVLLPPTTQPEYKVAGFFSGVGGIERGFALAGWKIVWSNEIDARAVQTLRANMEHDIVQADIYTIQPEDLPDVDAIVGGFPCQAFSQAGLQRGFEDERGQVFFRLTHLIEGKRPRIVCLENVGNIVSHDKGNTFRVINRMLEDLGYKLHTLILNAAEYGNIPQNRARIFFCGFREARDWENFVQRERLELTTRAADLLDLDARVDAKYYYTPEKCAFYAQLESDITKQGVFYQWRRSYVRPNKSGVCPTLTANMGTGGNNVPLILTRHGIRKLTPRECFRLMGYGDDFILPPLADSHLYKQAGNSVVVPVVQRLAQAILNAVQLTDRGGAAAPEVQVQLPTLSDMYAQVMEEVQLPPIMPAPEVMHNLASSTSVIQQQGRELATQVTLTREHKDVVQQEDGVPTESVTSASAVSELLEIKQDSHVTETNDSSAAGAEQASVAAQPLVAEQAAVAVQSSESQPGHEAENRDSLATSVQSISGQPATRRAFKSLREQLHESGLQFASLAQVSLFKSTEWRNWVQQWQQTSQSRIAESLQLIYKASVQPQQIVAAQQQLHKLLASSVLRNVGALHASSAEHFVRACQELHSSMHASLRGCCASLEDLAQESQRLHEQLKNMFAQHQQVYAASKQALQQAAAEFKTNVARLEELQASLEAFKHRMSDMSDMTRENLDSLSPHPKK